MSARRGPGYDSVWSAVLRIPRGRVITYGALAAWCGRPGHARFAGYALHNTPPGMEIPWHRVINARGKISLPGRAGDTQRRLLEAEGIRVVDGRVDLARYGWKPGRKGR